MTVVLQYLAALSTTHFLVSLDHCSSPSVALGTYKTETRRDDASKRGPMNDKRGFAIYRNAFR